MKVIKHGDTKSTAPEIVTERTTCPICGCEFEYDSNDVQRDIHNNAHVNCPECGCFCVGKFSRSNLPRFPEDFYDFNYGVPQNNSDINDWIREATDYFLAHPDETLKFIACGDSALFALNMEDGVHFYVAQGYYEASID